MATNYVLQLIDVNGKNMDKSPSRKRALSDEVYDYAVNLPADSESGCGSEEEKDCDNLGKNDKSEQVAILQSPLSKEIRKKMAGDDWELEIRKTDVNNASASYFQELSDEMILHIFHFLRKRVLVKAALVCKRWHRITQDESLWTRMDLSYHQLQPGSLGHVLSRQVMMLQLELADICYPPIVPGCNAYNEDFRSRLLLLDLTSVRASSDTLVEILKRCLRLKKISLERVEINEEVLAALSSNRDIEVVNLALARGVNERGLRHLLGNCLNIRELNIAWTHLDAVSIQFVCSNVPKCLDRLNMCGCRMLLNDKHIMELVSRCGKLRELDIHDDCSSLTNEAVLHITLLKDLNTLALSRSNQVSYNSLLQLKKIPSLLYLDVHNGYDYDELRHVQDKLGSNVQINRFKFSSVARPSVGTSRSIWNMRVTDDDDDDDSNINLEACRGCALSYAQKPRYVYQPILSLPYRAT